MSSFETTMCEKEVRDPLVALNALLVRGASSSMLEDRILEALREPTEGVIEDLYVMAFQIRDVRGGKGERLLFKQLLEILFKIMPDLTLVMMDLIPEYGCWDDLYHLTQPKMVSKVIEMTVAQLKKDSLTDGPISLCAKWAPREDRQGHLAKILAKELFRQEDSLSRRLKSYRKLVSGLNRKLQTTEIDMCNRQFALIEPEKVPGRCLQKHINAFLNETLKNFPRHPDDKDRIECRNNFQEHFAKAARGEVSFNASQIVFPHELVKRAVKILTESYPDAEDEKNAILGMWHQMVKDAKASGGLTRSIAMCDFSGSMRCSESNGDTPYWVSLAMGLLISEVTTDEFKDSFLTFDSTPILHTMSPDANLFERLRSIKILGQGTSTDFQAAMDVILTQLKNSRCIPGQEPDNLIVLTDMDWDTACGCDQASFFTGHSYRNVVRTNPWLKHVEMIRESFKKAGEDIWGVPFKMPQIIIWNIASKKVEFNAHTDDVLMISGWSPTLFNTLQKGGEVRPSTPLESLRVQLDTKRYDLVRNRIRKFFS